MNQINTPARFAVSAATARIQADKKLAPCHKSTIIRQECTRYGVTVDDFVAAATQIASEIRATL